MSTADKNYIKTCLEILNCGVSDADEVVRPKWADGTSAHTRKIFGVVNRYNVGEEFPIMTLRRTYWRSAIDEVLWIWQKKSNDIHQLNSKVWNQWADPSGTIGRAYGYQASLKYLVKDVDFDKARLYFGEERCIRLSFEHLEGDPLVPIRIPNILAAVIQDSRGNIYMDQVDKLLYDLKYNRSSRRMILTTWNPKDSYAMALTPCAYSMTFNVVGDVLNAILNQRSQDMLTANNWNVVQYAALLSMFAHVSGLKVGELVHVIADCHIYDRHISMVEEMIRNKEYDAPVFELDENIYDFYQFDKNSFNMIDYKYSEFNHEIPVAI